MATTKREPKRDQIQDDLERFTQAVEQARSNREFIVTCISDARFVKILAMIDRNIEDAKESLCTIDKKDVEKVQAGIIARRELLATFKGAYQADLDEAVRQLTEFKRQNELFLQSQGETQALGLAEEA